MKGITYSEFKKANYLSSPLFNSENRTLLLALRTRTVNGIKNDFKGHYSDLKCPLKCGEDDILQHILDCRVLKSHHSSIAVANKQVIYQDIFSNNILKQQQATELYRQLLKIRTTVLKSQPEAVTGPLH